MIKWVKKELHTIYGTVENIYFGVEDETAKPQNNNDEDADNNNSEDENKDVTAHQVVEEKEMKVAPVPAAAAADGVLALTEEEEEALATELETAEGLLGAVLWNSNTAALRHLHRHVFPLHPQVQANMKQYKYKEKYLHREGEEVQVPLLEGLTIVEVGAGVGSLGIALAMAGATVLVTDLPDIFPLMKANQKLNRRAIGARNQSCVNGGGRCEVMGWKWGPTDTIGLNPHKRLRQNQNQNNTNKHKGSKQKNQKQQQHQHKEEHKQQQAAPSTTTTTNEEDDKKKKETIIKDMLAELATPSISCRAAEQVLFSKNKATNKKHQIDYVIMCDALYGNPKDWPALLYTLSEISLLLNHEDKDDDDSDNEDADENDNNKHECKIINFCEQRVRNVEGNFLALLHAQNKKNKAAYKNYIRREDADTERWREGILQETITELAETMEQKQKEDILLAAVDLQQLGVLYHSSSSSDKKKNNNNNKGKKNEMHYWNWERSEIQDEKSELGMPIYVTELELSTVKRKSVLIAEDEDDENEEKVEEAETAVSQKGEKRPRND